MLALSKAFALEAAPGRLLAELWSKTGLPGEWTQVASAGDKAQPIFLTYKTPMRD